MRRHPPVLRSPLMAEPAEPQGGNEPPEGTPPAAPPSEPPQGEPGDLAAEVERWKQEARKHEKRAKEGAAAERRLAELEDANKTELERAQQTARQETDRANAAELRAIRAEVAARKGLTASQAKRLQGTTEEELEADADELLADFKPSEPPPQGNGGKPQGTPVPRLTPGAVPGAGARETDPAKLAAMVPRR